MTQEKLAERAFAAWKPVVGFPLRLIGAITLKQAGEVDDVIEREMVKFARAELQKAVDIAEKYVGIIPATISHEIRKLME